jgi:hypothetical protein
MHADFADENPAFIREISVPLNQRHPRENAFIRPNCDTIKISRVFLK